MCMLVEVKKRVVANNLVVRNKSLASIARTSGVEQGIRMEDLKESLIIITLVFGTLVLTLSFFASFNS